MAMLSPTALVVSANPIDNSNMMVRRPSPICSYVSTLWIYHSHCSLIDDGCRSLHAMHNKEADDNYIPALPIGAFIVVRHSFQAETGLTIRRVATLSSRSCILGVSFTSNHDNAYKQDHIFNQKNIPAQCYHGRQKTASPSCESLQQLFLLRCLFTLVYILFWHCIGDCQKLKNSWYGDCS
jgi:hypothetical protein